MVDLTPERTCGTSPIGRLILKLVRDTLGPNPANGWFAGFGWPVLTFVDP
jgi:hypothetical protein